MYNTFDGHFNPKRKFVTRVDFFFLVVHFSVGSKCVLMSLNTRD